MNQGPIVTASAYSQARHKYRHTAFIELSEYTRDFYYEDGNYQRWHGYRLSAIDGSTLVLPNTQALAERYGSCQLPKTKKIEAEALPMGRLVASFDVLNHIVHNAKLSHYKSYEVAEAATLLGDFSSEDVLLFDRHYASYEFIGQLSLQGCHFVIRCPKSSFSQANALFEQGPASKICELKVNRSKQDYFKSKGLPLSMKVRFVRVLLDTGEVEVLVTSLLDETITPEAFKEVYHQRWGVETLFDILKNRLRVENFSGCSVESVLQDFYSTILLTNMESLLTEDLEAELNEANTKYQKQVNKMVSFNAIKNKAFELIFSETKDHDWLLNQLIALFKTNPTLVRPNRSFERNKSGANRRLRHYKTKRKVCF